MPIKTYSSGMKSRLGFGLSMAFKFDYYLVDEITSVGDANFKKKCDAIFNSRRKESNFLMVSHSMSALQQYCDAALFIGRDNEVIFYESVSEAIQKYKVNEGL